MRYFGASLTPKRENAEEEMSISKMVVVRQKSGSKVVASVRTHKGKARDGRAELLVEELGEAAE